MAIKTKPREKTQVEKSKREEASRKIELGFIDMAAVFDNDDWDETDERDFQNYLKIRKVADNKYDIKSKDHTWISSSMNGIAIHREDVPKYENSKRFKCTSCGLDAIGIPEDDYSPPKWKMLTTSKKLADMSCSDIIIEDILK